MYVCIGSDSHMDMVVVDGSLKSLETVLSKLISIYHFREVEGVGVF